MLKPTYWSAATEVEGEGTLLQKDLDTLRGEVLTVRGIYVSLIEASRESKQETILATMETTHLNEESSQSVLS